MKYSYYAVFEYADDGINISFPDLNALSCALDTSTGITMAEEALCLSLHGTPLTAIPAPSTLDDLVLTRSQKAFLISVELEHRANKLFAHNVEDLIV